MTQDELLKLLAIRALERSDRGTLVGNHDVDTLDMKADDGTINRVRVLGVDGPEADQPFGKQAGEGLRQIVGNQPLRRQDASLEGYGRNVSRLTTGDGRDVGYELARQGLAAVPSEYGNENPIYRDGLLRAEAEAKSAGKGMWGLSGDGEMPWDYRNRKTREAGRESGEYAKETSVLEDIGGAFDYVGNVVRSGVVGALDPKGTALQYASQAAQKHRYTDPSQVKDTITKNIFHIPQKVRFGADDGKFQMGDLVDEGIDLGIGIGTDPLTYVAAGPVNKLMGKGVRSVGKAAGFETLGTASDAIVGRAALGSMMGAGLPGDGGEDDDTSLTTRLAGAALGGLGAAFAPAIAKPVVGAARTFSDGMVDRYMEITRGVQHYSGKAKIARESVDQSMNNAAGGAMRYKATVLDHLEAPDKMKFVSMLEEGKTWEIEKRNWYLNSNVGQISSVDSTRDAFRQIKLKSEARLAQNARSMGDQFVRSTNALFEENKRWIGLMNDVKPAGDAPLIGLGAFWPDVWASRPANFELVEGSFADMTIKRASSLHRQQSQYAMAVEQFVKAGGSGLSLEDAKAATHLLGKRGVLSSEDYIVELNKQVAPVREFVTGVVGGKIKIPDEFIVKGIEDSVDTYYRRYGHFTVDKTAREAIEFMGDFMDRKVGQGAVQLERDAKGVVIAATREAVPDHPMMGTFKNMESLADKWNVVQMFVVRNQLFGGLAWLKNNFWENSTKAYMSGGLVGLMDSTMFNNARKGIFQDIWAMSHGEGTSALRSADKIDLAKAVELGVVSNPAARALGSGSKEYLQKFMYSDGGLDRAIKRKAMKDAAPAWEKGLDAWGEALVGSIGRFGSTLENNSRYMAWQRFRKSMVEAVPQAERTAEKLTQIDNWASDAVKRTFYDYSDISEFNRLVTKKIAPYASYYMKNLPYYVGAAFDTSTHGKEIVTTAMRTQVIEKAIRHFGTDPTEADKEGFTDYLLNNRPRILGRDKDGLSVGVMPSFSRDDALRMAGIMRPGEMAKSYLEKVNPMLKAPVEVASGTDFFTGGELYPSNIPGKRGEDHGRKYLFGRGFLPAAVGLADIDERGNPYTTSDLYAGADKLRSAVLPLPGIESAASIWGQHLTGKRDVGYGAFNRFISPLQDVDVSNAMMRVQRSMKKKQKELDRE